MPSTLQIDIPLKLRKALEGLSPVALRTAVRQGMSHGADQVTAQIVKTRFSGRGPISLGRVTGTAARSVRHAPAEIRGNAVEVEIGSNLGYVKAHEFGFKGAVKVKAHTRKTGAKVRAHARQVSIRERRMIRGGAEEHRQEFVRSIADEVKSMMQ